MKRLFNDKVSPYLTLPDGTTVTKGGSLLVLNEEILRHPDIQRRLEDPKGGIRIEDEPRPTGVA